MLPKSPRLLAALDLLTEVRCLADVGTDHGYFPIAAVQSGKASRAVASDNKPAPLATAAEHIARSGLQDRIVLVLADGLSFLRVDIAAVSIMGMGGFLIERILDAADLSAVEQLILGPNNDHAAVRGWLEDHGWRIADERFVRDRGHDYQLISAVPGKMSLNPEERTYGPILLKTRNEGLLGHLRQKIAALSEARSLARDPDKRQELEIRIRNLEELIR